MSKGEETRRAILDRGTDLASQVGLRGVTIGVLADTLSLSKSGLFAHFKSKEALDIALIEHSGARFTELVIRPALKAPRGEPRLRELFKRTLDWPLRLGLPGGCPMIAAAAELDDCPGPARDALVAQQKDWLDTLSNLVRIAIREGHFRDHVDPEQYAFELYALQLSHHLAARLLRDPQADAKALSAFEALVARARAETPLQRSE
jgi:AcrR family transcriptional regulator